VYPDIGGYNVGCHTNNGDQQRAKEEETEEHKFKFNIHYRNLFSARDLVLNARMHSGQVVDARYEVLCMCAEPLKQYTLD